MSGYTDTDEQTAIINSESNDIVVEARAGAGKTATLVKYANTRPDKRILYVCFNKSIQAEAETKFGHHVKCQTTHSLAFGKFGVKYRHKLGNIFAMRVKDFFNTKYIPAFYATEVLLNYLHSADEVISKKHLDIGRPQFARHLQDSAAILMAQQLWDAAKDLDNTEISMPHDGYLKLFQLSKPYIDRDIILFDEAQDANPVTTAIVDDQKDHAVVVKVGDAAQGIYGWRGATNALAKELNVGADFFSLSQSFRFGEEIASLARYILTDVLGNDVGVKGMPSIDSCVTKSHRSFMESGYTILARTNARIIEAAFMAVEKGLKPAFIGGFNAYRVEDILDTHSFKNGTWGKGICTGFSSYKDMQVNAKESGDPVLNSVINIIEIYGNNIDAMIRKINREEVPPSCADVVFSTTHRSKGLEFDKVILLDDFININDVLDEDNPQYSVEGSEEEINIFYVAVTRAINELVLAGDQCEWVDRNVVHHGSTKPKTVEPAQVEQKEIILQPQIIDAGKFDAVYMAVSRSRNVTSGVFQTISTSGDELHTQHFLIDDENTSFQQAQLIMLSSFIDDNDGSFIFHTDSQFITDGMTGWMRQWLDTDFIGVKDKVEWLKLLKSMQERPDERYMFKHISKLDPQLRLTRKQMNT